MIKQKSTIVNKKKTKITKDNKWFVHSVSQTKFLMYTSPFSVKYHAIEFLFINYNMSF